MTKADNTVVEGVEGAGSGEVDFPGGHPVSEESLASEKVVTVEGSHKTVAETLPVQTTPDESYQEDIRQLNRHFLLLTRDMARHRPDLALSILGVPTGIQTIIAGLTLDSIERLLAHPHALQFSVRFSESHWGRIAEKTQGRKGPVDDSSQMVFRVLAAASSFTGTEGKK